jgi:hypothetical protein
MHLIKTRVYNNILKNPQNNILKAQMLSYYQSLPFRHGKKPTMNRLQNLLQMQRTQRLLDNMSQAPKFKTKREKYAYALKLGLIKRWSYIKREVSILFNSRIIQFMVLVPFLYGSYSVGQYIYTQ